MDELATHTSPENYNKTEGILVPSECNTFHGPFIQYQQTPNGGKMIAIVGKWVQIIYPDGQIEYPCITAQAWQYVSKLSSEGWKQLAREEFIQF